MDMLPKHTRSRYLFGVLLGGMLAVASMAVAVEIGEHALDFTLPSTTGETISLGQFRGKQHVLLEFYVNDFGPTWTANLSARKVDYDKFQALDVQILGISANDAFSQKTFADSLKLPYPLLSDFPDLNVIRSYGLLRVRPYPGDPNRLVARRAFFLIDKQGIVQGRWFIEDGLVFPTESILETARKIAGKS